VRPLLYTVLSWLICRQIRSSTLIRAYRHRYYDQARHNNNYNSYLVLANTSSESQLGERAPYEGDLMLHSDLPIELSVVTLNKSRPLPLIPSGTQNLKRYITAADATAQVHTAGTSCGNGLKSNRTPNSLKPSDLNISQLFPSTNPRDERDEDNEIYVIPCRRSRVTGLPCLEHINLRVLHLWQIPNFAETGY
jgi:hypothetical protein